MRSTQRALLTLVAGGWSRLAYAGALMLLVGGFALLGRDLLFALQDGGEAFAWIRNWPLAAFADRGSVLLETVSWLVPAWVAALGIGTALGLTLPARGWARGAALALVSWPLLMAFDDALRLVEIGLRVLFVHPPARLAQAAALAWQGSVLVALLVHAALRSISMAFWQAARMDGLSATERLRWLIAPCLWPSWLAASVLLAGLAAHGLIEPGAWPLAGLTDLQQRLLLLALVLPAAGLLQMALTRPAWLPWPMPIDEPGPRPGGISGRDRWLLWSGIIGLLVAGLPLLMLAAMAAGALVDGGTASRTLDPLALLWPAQPTLEPAWLWLTGPDGARSQLPGLLLAALLALISLLLAWPAAWALSRLSVDSPAARLARGLLLVAALLPAWASGASGLAQRLAGWLPASGAFSQVFTFLLLMPATLAVSIWLLERMLRRQQGFPVLRGGDPVRRRADEQTIQSGRNPAAFATLIEDPRLWRSACFVIVFTTLFGWRVLAGAGRPAVVLAPGEAGAVIAAGLLVAAVAAGSMVLALDRLQSSLPIARHRRLQ